MFFFPFHQQFIGKIFIAKAMHISYSIADKFISFRIIEEGKCIFVFHLQLISKQTDNTRIFHLQNYFISHHIHPLLL